MQSIVVLGGLGDVYLVAALYESFCYHHRTREVELVIKSGHQAVVDLFPGTRYRVNDQVTFGTEANPDFQRTHENRLGNGNLFFAHPRMERTPLSICGLPAKPFVCQADLFRMVLGVPLDAPLTVPKVPPPPPAPQEVVVVEAHTWPNTQPAFHNRLVNMLRVTGWDVWVNDKKLPLRELFERAAAAAWVIGPQCGLMSIFVTGRFPCRKILATPSIDDGKAREYWAPSTFPYAYVSRFAGEDFDVEEFKIDDDHHSAINLIINCMENLRPHDPRPVTSVMMPLTPSDLLDRLAVLTVKCSKFSGGRLAAVVRETRRYLEAAIPLLNEPGVSVLFALLVDRHRETFEILERAVPEALGTGHMAVADHAAAIRANKDRVVLKHKIDAALRGATVEVKSYYG
jgi:hypothetical protein